MTHSTQKATASTLAAAAKSYAQAVKAMETFEAGLRQNHPRIAKRLDLVRMDLAFTRKALTAQTRAIRAQR